MVKCALSIVFLRIITRIICEKGVNKYILFTNSHGKLYQTSILTLSYHFLRFQAIEQGIHL